MTDAPVDLEAEVERLKARNRNMRKALRELNKLQHARAETIRAISHVPFAQRQDYLLEARGKLGQRVDELNRALGNDMKNWKAWPELVAQVYQLRASAPPADEVAGLLDFIRQMRTPHPLAWRLEALDRLENHLKGKR